MHTLSDFDDIIFGRKSIRLYDTQVKIPRELLKKILTESFTAPSSLNMQPCRFVVVDSEEGKEKIRTIMADNLTQSDTSSAVIFIFGDLEAHKNLERIINETAVKNSLSDDIKEAQKERISSYYSRFTEEYIRATATFDAGLVGMSLMLVARKYGYDTCPIGGFDKSIAAKTLGLNPNRYQPLIAFSLGKKTENGSDSYRLPIEEVTTWL